MAVVKLTLMYSGQETFGWLPQSFNSFTLYKASSYLFLVRALEMVQVIASLSKHRFYFRIYVLRNKR